MQKPNIVPRVALLIERLVINRAQGVFFTVYESAGIALTQSADDDLND